MSDGRDLLQHSPLDRGYPPRVGENLIQIRSTSRPRWSPSRYTVRAATEDGRLILWNSYSGAMSVFEPSQRAVVEERLRRRGFSAEKQGLVAYLADRGFIVAEGTDEYRRVQLAFGREQYRTDTLELILLASEDCNFRCTYCYEDFQRGTMRPEVRRGVRALVERRLPTLSRLRVSWFGGEPLYGFTAIEELAPFFVRCVDEHAIGFNSHMTTNGFLLTPERAERLFAWRIRDLQITLDGDAADHDRKRPGRDGSGTFDTIYRNLQSLAAREEDFRVTIRVNFDRDNHPRLEPFLDRVQSSFADDRRFRLAFHAVGRWGGPRDEELEVCGVDESRRVLEDLKRAAARRGIAIAGLLKDARGPGTQVCYAARPYNFIVGADGKLMKCTIVLDKREDNIVGHLQEDGEVVLDEDRMALWTEPAFESDASCRKCVVLPTCQGVHCPLIRIQKQERPCPSSRLRLKQEMRRVLEIESDGARRVEVRQEVVA